MSAESPTPHLPRGAGGPLRRAAGRGSRADVLVLEPDPLVRLLVAPAVAALGFGGVAFAVAGAVPAPAAVFVPLDGLPDCREAGVTARAGARGAVLVGYGQGPLALLAAHRAHRCCDLVMRLSAPAGSPRLQHLPAGDPIAAAGLSLREADVLVLLLADLTTPAIAARLGVAECTARSHCRAVLRKLAMPDRRALRAALLASDSAACSPPPSGLQRSARQLR